MYNRTLERQIKKTIGEGKPIPKKWASLLALVSETYDHYEADRVLLERSMELSSKELFEANQFLSRQRDELEAKTHELEQAYRELKATQAQLIQSEKMAALGQLIAGVAHEINTPLGAINAAGSVLDKLLPQVLSKQPELFKTFTPELEYLFQQFVNQSLEGSQSLSSREERQYIREITEFLRANNVEKANSLAIKLVKAGVYKNYEPYLPLFLQENSEAIIELAFNIGRLRVNINNIILAVAKTQKIVFALKSYSYKSSSEYPEPYNIAKNLDTILTIYHNQLKHGIQTAVDIPADIPEIDAYVDELNQVWTNIIHNAIQAMQGKGELNIQVRSENGEVVVNIQDNGPGIPEELQEKIFEPFFTTKKQGEGSGLGLDICRKIVQKHNGKISVQSQPGNTIFSVHLPKRLNNATISS
ncbi:MAG: ATP-binding protein [Bacteroidia bacterium]|nr:ATP-binding protein [Bacteroidia bacterium]MDW8157566.1 ATP-binding protein [Bacteroidia bacterium]